jgi:hypothetical protein
MMTDTDRDMVTMTVRGTPAPQGSKTAFRVGKGAKARTVVTESGRAKLGPWRDAVAIACREQLDARGGRQLGGDGGRHGAPVLACVRFMLPKPRSRPKYLLWAVAKPDLDKLVRGVLDACGTDAGLLAEDSRVVAIYASKRYAEPGQAPGAWIRLVTLDHHTLAVPLSTLLPDGVVAHD